jgi:hypothetical protein
MGAISNSSMGMMAAFGNMDSDQMLATMKSIFGPADYQKMVDHLATHRAGQAPNDPNIDSMMHRIMDGMLQNMPDDRGHMMPMMPGS